MPPLAECLFYPRSTGTCLTRTGWVDFYQETPGTFSLVRQLIDKTTPSRITDLLRKISPCQPLYVQILDRNKPEVIDQRAAQFVVKVGSLISQVNVSALQNLNGLSSALRPLLSSGHFPLGNSQLALSLFVVTGILNRGTIGERSECSNANIDAYILITFRQWFGFALDSKKREPSACLTLDREGFNRPLKGSVQANANNANLRHAKTVVSQCASYPSKGHTVIAGNGAETRESRAAAFASFKESLERLINSGQNGFRGLRVDCGHVGAQSLDLSHLIDLIKPTNGFSRQTPRVSSFLQSRVVKFATNSKVLVKNLGLSFSRINPIAECTDHVVIISRGFSLVGIK